MAAEFALQCDGCHTVFKEGGDRQREPVTVGCFHTLCRACAEGDKGAYGAFGHLASEEAGEGEYEVDARVKQLVRGRCVVCGGGMGEVWVQEVVLEAMRGEGGEAEEPEEGGREERLCELCAEEEAGCKRAAAHFCEDCNVHMCSFAAKAHSDAHSVKRLGAQPALCPTHGQPCLFLCHADKCFVCAECVATTHNNHLCTEVGSGFVEELKGWLEEGTTQAAERVEALEGAEAGLVQERDKLISSARQTIDGINAVFERLEDQKKALIADVERMRKETCQRLNDVRTASRLLWQGVEAAKRALVALHNDSQSFAALQHASVIEQQLRRLVEASNSVRTHRGGATPRFQHDPSKLDAWRRSLKVLTSPSDTLIERGLHQHIHNQKAGALGTFKQCKNNCVALGYQACVLNTGGGGAMKDEAAAKRIAARAIAGGLRDKATAGDHHAQFLLGYFYHYALGVPTDHSKAVALLAKAVDHEHAPAQTLLGFCFFHGHGVRGNPARAVMLWARAAEQGHAVAQNNLANCCFRSGLDAAEHFFSLAAAQGDTSAQESLARLAWERHARA